MQADATLKRKKPARTSRPTAWRLLLNNQLAAAGLAILGIVVLLALLAPVLPLQNPDITSPADRLLPVLSPGHLLGTDHLGRDLLSRLIWGTRVSLAVGISATLVAAVIGSLIGIISGYYGGRVDSLLMRCIDMLMAFPYILLALAIVAALGPGLMNALYAIAIVNIPFFARNIRGVTLSVAHKEFIEAAKLSGKNNAAIVMTEVLPNVLPIIVITMSTTIGWMILETAGLSFLGLGAQPPQADLGSMLGEGRKLIINSPHVSIIPGLMIFFIVMSMNLLGDGIRDVLDPRLKSGALSRPASRTRIMMDNHGHQEDHNTGDYVLDVSHLKTHFHVGDSIYKAVNDVSFTVKAGQCLGIIGESGCGKSVTAMSLLGLVPSPPGQIVDGRVWFNTLGQTGAMARDLMQIDNESLRQIRGAKIACIFQDPLATLHPQHRVGDQLIEAILTHQKIGRLQARGRAVELLESVRISNPQRRMQAYPHQLSGGMRQRIGIAMALSNDPDIIIADEPTTALDVTVQAQVIKLLRNLQQQRHAALIFITHDFGVVSEICDEVAVMYAGKVVEYGKVDEVLDAPKHPYTQRLIECVPILGQPHRQLKPIPGMPPVVNNLPAGCAFAQRCDRRLDRCTRDDIELDEFSGHRHVRCINPVQALT